jgi:hypothetical protein
MPPIALLLGLGAVTAAVLLSQKSGSGGGASPQPVDPNVPHPEPGGPGLQTDPSQPFDCASAQAWLAQTHTAIVAAQTTCQTNPSDPVCAALPGWMQTWDAVAQDYKTHACDTPGLDCAAMANSLTIWTNQINQAKSACQANPSDPRCGSINGWLLTLGSLQASYTKSCPKTQADIAAECARLRAWMVEVTATAQGLGSQCHASNDAQACSDYNALMNELATVSADYNSSCGAHV